MADRASGGGIPGVPKQVFELDKDERWQARLEDARARREIALREKAGGKPQKARPKPWEVEGAAYDAPKPIEPVIQDRGDEKIDFADRLETIREAARTENAAQPKRRAVPSRRRSEPVGRKTPPDKAPPLTAPSIASPDPDPAPASSQRRQDAGSRARPKPSLVVPGAPDVAELASRYAATLDAGGSRESAADHAFVRAAADSQPMPPPRSEATLIMLPGAADTVKAPEAVAATPRPRIRPLGMAIALLALAALPLSTVAPPLETGPAMPEIVSFGVQPALGVTWSLYEPPHLTRSDDWQAPAAPGALAPVAPPAPVRISGSAPVLGEPLSGQDGSVGLSTIDGAPPEALEGGLTEPEGAMLDRLPDDLSTVPPVGALQREVVAAAPRPARARAETGVAVSSSSSEQAVPLIGEPLRITILAPARSDAAMAEDIASELRASGHELVRVQEVDQSIGARNLRYFFEADRASAAQLARRYDAELRDFTWFRPQPAERTAELWLAGRAAEAASVPAEPVPAPAVSSPSLLGQVFNRLGLGTDLPERIGLPPSGAQTGGN